MLATRLFNALDINRDSTWLNGFEHDSRSPKYEIWEEDNGYFVGAELPEIKKEDLEITLENGILRIFAKRSKDHRKVISSNIVRGDYLLKVKVTDNIDPDQITADLQAGFLTVKMPKSEKVRLKRIEIA